MTIVIEAAKIVKLARYPAEFHAAMARAIEAASKSGLDYDTIQAAFQRAQELFDSCEEA
jgi:hypothetical protein